MSSEIAMLFSMWMMDEQKEYGSTINPIPYW